MDEIIRIIKGHINKEPETDFDKGWDAGLSCAIDIIAMNSDNSSHENAHGG